MGEKIDLARISSLTGRSYRTVRKRLDEAGVTPIGESGKSILYDSAAALQAIFTTRRSDDADTLDLSRERALLAIEQTRRLQRENDEAEGKLAPIAVLTDALQRVGMQIVSILESLPLEMKRQNPRLSGHDIQTARKAIARICSAVAEIRLEDCPELPGRDGPTVN